MAKLVDENGAAVILKNNSPRYVVLDYSKIGEDSVAENQTVEELICFGSNDRNDSNYGNLQFIYYKEIQREIEEPQLVGMMKQ